MFFDDPVNVKIGENLRRIRKSRGLSMNDLSKMIKVAQQQVHKYETGEDRISASKLYKAAQALQAGLDSFFEGIAGPVEPSIDLRPATTQERATLRALARISNPQVRDAVYQLIVSLEKDSDLGSASKFTNNDVLTVMPHVRSRPASAQG